MENRAFLRSDPNGRWAIGAKSPAESGGGVWSWHTTPVPQLRLASAGDQLTASWIVPAIPFVLQQNLDLTPSNWVTVPEPATLGLLQYQVALFPTNGRAFYRLASP